MFTRIDNDNLVLWGSLNWPFTMRNDFGYNSTMEAPLYFSIEGKLLISIG